MNSVNLAERIEMHVPMFVFLYLIWVVVVASHPVEFAYGMAVFCFVKLCRSV